VTRPVLALLARLALFTQYASPSFQHGFRRDIFISFAQAEKSERGNRQVSGRRV